MVSRMIPKLVILTAGAAASVASAQLDVVAPNSLSATNGTGGLNTIVRDAANPRSYQIIYAASELTSAVGQQLTGITWRSFQTQASFPNPALVYADYEIRVATSTVPPASMSTTFASNLGANVVLVQDGPLTFPLNNFPGTPGTTPFQFGGLIAFQTPFLYTGGDLVIEIRHPGATSGGTGFLDGLTTASTVQGYGVTTKAMSATTMAATTGTFATAYVSQLHFGTIVPPATGACCAPDGSCTVLTAAQCGAAGGIYAGDNITCAAANCPPGGACCYSDSGTCTILTSALCTLRGGTWQGAGSTCGNCAPTGACCTSDGSCVVLPQSKCTTANGIYRGDSTNCATATACWTAPTLWKNGPLATGNLAQSGFGAPGGTEFSEVANNLGVTTIANTTSGFSALAAIRNADDFTISAPGGWQIDKLILPTYQTGSTTTSTITGATLQIWNGRPGDAGAAVVFGDTTTNRMASTTFANVYRCFNSVVPPACGGAATIPDLTRPVMNVEITVGTTLPAGTYWLDWNIAGSLASGPWSPSATIKGLRSASAIANARQFNAAWVNTNDGGQGCAAVAVQQEYAFELRGSILGGGCYANCDGSTVPPILNSLDFGCFLTKFAAGDTYANCDGSSVPPVLNSLDFGCFLTKFAGGCT